MPDPVKIKLLTELEFAASATTSNHKEKVITELFNQYVRDFCLGSFGSASPTTLNGISDNPADLERLTTHNFASATRGSTAHTEVELERGRVPWCIDFDDPVLEDTRLGLQHLFGILVGDSFSRSHPRVHKAETEVSSVVLGDYWGKFFDTYRSESNSIDDIRRKFALTRPFLAFTVKPRTGWHELDIDVVAKLVREVILAGFDMVEWDTRYLWPRSDEHDQNLIRLINVAHEAGQARGRGAVFSPNLTMPWSAVEPLVNRIFQECDHELLGFKVDGNLDGLSTIQAIRRGFPEFRPIITSYPLLAYSPIGKRLGPDTFKKWLALSGADIIYPGGAPRLRAGGEIDRDSVRGAQIRYDKIVSKGWPMPSVAGGVHPGDFHALIELLGYNHALFVGGGVALHKDGILAGVKWASEALDEAAELGRDASETVWQRSSKVFGDNRSRFEDVEVGETNFEYVNPEQLLEQSDVARFQSRPAVEETDPRTEPDSGL